MSEPIKPEWLKQMEEAAKDPNHPYMGEQASGPGCGACGKHKSLHKPLVDNSQESL